MKFIKENIFNDQHQADKIMLAILWLHLPFAAFIVPYSYGTFKEGAVGGIIICIIATISYLTSKGTFLHRQLNALLLLSYSVIFISVQFGRIEMHFHVFTALPMLLIYKEWRIIPPAGLLIAVQHLAFNYCQANNIDIGGLPIIVFEGQTGIKIVLLHAVFVVFECAILCYYSYILKQKDLRLASINSNLEELVESKTKQLIEEQKVNEEQRAQIVSQSKLSALGEMAGGIAHEINNPLAIISMTASSLRLLSKKDKLTDEKLMKLLDDMENTVTRITKIITGLRNISRDTSTEKLELCNIQDLLKESVSLCSEKFKSNGVKLEVLYENNLENTDIRVLRVQFSQVILNLLNNAYDEIKKDPDPWVTISCKQEGESIVFTITDSGNGIPQDIQDKIFNPFFTTKDIGEGTGLGLSLSHTIVKKHKGEFYYDASSENTTFVIKIPLITDELDQKSPA